jgi:uncharacterized DUF497 family protein
MKLTYDPAKNDRNIRERGLSFERAVEFDFVTAHTAVDRRQDYGETRHTATGYLGDRLHVICFTETYEGIRVISFRKANERERKNYEETKTTPHG